MNEWHKLNIRLFRCSSASVFNVKTNRFLTGWSMQAPTHFMLFPLILTVISLLHVVALILVA